MARPRQISDEQILSATRERVLAQGPNVSLEVVAEDLGVTVPAILKRFGSRRALMLAALTPPEPEWIAFLNQGPRQAPLEELLQEMFLKILAFNTDAIPCVIALRESGIATKEFLGRDPTRGHRALVGWLKRASALRLITATELEGIAFAIFGALMGRAFTAHLVNAPLSERDRQSYAQDLSRVFTRALTP
ncbi:MAG: TetR/AcrR family transcriptional regulator [Myxococcota bacterium]|nr:TetR/AcrR family transcriptional regulator [Myxococcota bacterium]